MEKFIDREKLCEWLCCSYSTLDRKLKAGEIPEPFFGRGRKLLWCPKVLEKWLNDRQSQSIAPPVTSSVQQRRKDKSFQQRQEAADAVLKRHNESRKTVNKKPQPKMKGGTKRGGE